MVIKKVRQAIYLLAFIIGGLIFYNACLFPGQVYGDNHSLPNILLIIVSALILLPFLMRIIRISNVKCWKLIYAIVIVFQVCFQLYLSVKMIGVLGTDDIHVRLQIARLIHHDFNWMPYFSWAPNNVGTVIFASAVIKLIMIFKVPIGIAINVFNLLCMDIALLVGWLLFGRMGNKRAQNIYFILVNLFSPLILMAFIMYADVPATMFCMLGVYAFISYRQDKSKSRYIWLVLSAISISWAAFTKENAIILLIAAVLAIILTTDIKKLFIDVLILISIFGITSGTQSLLKKADNFHVISSQNFPYTYWIALGLNPGTNGTWKPNSASVPDPYSDTARFKIKTAKDAHDKFLIKKELREMGIKGTLTLYSKKINEQYSMGTNGVETKIFNTRNSYSKVYEYLYGNKRSFLFMVDQVLWLTILVGFLIECFSLIKSGKSLPMILGLFVVGIFCFHVTMWEVQQRYGFIALLPLIILSCLGLTRVSGCSADIKKIASKLNTPVALMLGIGLLLGVVNSLPLTYRVPSSEVVYGHDFPTTSYILKPGQTLKEKSKINTSFNDITLDLPANNYLKAAISQDGKKWHQLKIGKNNKEKYSAGTYIIKVTNTGDKGINIGILKSKPLTVLGESINKRSNKFLCYSMLLDKRVRPVSAITLLVWGVIMLVILCNNYLYILKCWRL